MNLWLFKMIRRCCKWALGQAVLFQKQLTRIERKVNQILATAAELKDVVTNLKREVTETAEAMKQKLDKIAELIAAGANDAEVRAAVDEVLPDLQASVAALDALQDHPTPVE